MLASPYFAIEVISVIMLILVLIGLYTRQDKQKSSRALIWAAWANLLCSGANALIYIEYASGWTWFLFSMTSITYIFGNITMLLFTYYDYCFIREYTPLKKWLYYFPISICILNFFLSIYSVAKGDVFTSDGGVYTETEGLPVVIFLFYALCMIYMPLPAIIKRKELGTFKCVMLCVFSIFPLVTLVLYASEIMDYSYVSGAISILAMYMFLDNQLVKDKDEKLRLEMKAHEMDLEKAKVSAEAANLAKSSFLFNMSHDIRTPMNAILGFANLLEKHKEDGALVSNYTEKIKTSGDYLLSLINNVLDMARIESGKAELNEEVYDILDPKFQTAPIFENLAVKKNITMTFRDKVEHRHVYIDKMKIQQIVVNLISNAIKYTPEGGEVLYTFEEIPCSREGYATYVSTIKDNGIGMSQEFKETIFDLFSRERKTTDSKVTGTGLGMSIVKKLVDMMGGNIEIDTELGKGTTVTLTLSHRIAEPQETGNDPGNTGDIDVAKFAGKRILLAEDNELNAEIAVAMLEDLGLVVEVANDGAECVQKLSDAEAGYFNVVLMDVQMPILNGYDATRRIRSLEDAQKANIPIIAMTANVFERDKRDASQAGMNGHISKPVNREVIITELQKYM